MVLISTSAVLHSATDVRESNLQEAYFAAGCFWGVEKIFGKIDGVVETDVGYAGGKSKNPSYEAVTTGMTGHAEAIRVQFNPEKVSYEQLLAVFYQWHDPTTLNRQGPDIGSQYRSAVFTTSADQEAKARKARDLLDESGIYDKKIVTEITSDFEYYLAEDYHQKYLEKNPRGYCSHFLQKQEIPGILGVEPVNLSIK